MAAGSTAHTFTPGSSHRRATHGHSVLQPKVELPTLLLLNPHVTAHHAQPPSSVLHWIICLY